MKTLIRQPKRIKFTKEGLDKLKQELESLTLSRKPAVAELKRAREMGDLSENGLYKAARMNLSSIDARIRKTKFMLKVADVYDAPMGAVGIGSSVEVEQDGKRLIYQIVGDYEANPLEKKISSNSPIGRALIGKKVDDEFSIYTPKGEIKIKVIKILS